MGIPIGSAFIAQAQELEDRKAAAEGREPRDIAATLGSYTTTSAPTTKTTEVTGRSVYAHLYKTPEWRKGRQEFLQQHRYCELCAAEGRSVLADTVHHKVPHKGRVSIFFDRTQWQAMCTGCHARHGSFMDRHGFAPGCDEHGNPLDPNHPFNRMSRQGR